ncbi:MAG: uncharacterized protein JWL85_127 [Candidatus Saccharibacteria bacterium]|nr:uncharacterized protein [Candidatus Saccharibacteria bacterium]
MTASDVELHCFRHAESEANVNWHLISGRSNETPLTPLGIDQAKALGRYLVANEILPDVVYASPAERTLQTAHYALNEMGLDIKPTTHDGLQEMDMGLWVGQPRDHVYSEAVLAEIERLGKDFKAEGGQSMNEVGEQMFRVASEVANLHADDSRTLRIFFFAHGVAIRCLASHIHNWSQTQTYEAHTPNASDSKFTMRNGMWQLNYLGKRTSQL